jgi:SAM-dependent methyltransferase
MDGSDINFYDERYYAWQRKGAFDSARALLPVVLELVRPNSILDVGCGTGAWLRVAIDEGITDVFGIDAGTGELVIPEEKFVRLDLDAPFDLGRRFDLVICMEVAEHLASERAESLVDDLCRAADCVLFSAAIPGQGAPGSGEHPNEQWQSYWAGLFDRRGYRTADVVRPRIWDDDRIAFWYRQNAFIATTPELARDFNESGPVRDVVHPDLWRHVNATLWAKEASPREILARLPQAVRRAARRRILS